MIHKITLENFFSFKEKTEIELNPNVNVLVGINGSGKSNFIRAIKLLHDSVIGAGFENVFLKDWGGFDSVANFNTKQADFIKIKYEFDKNAIKRAVNNQGYDFGKNPIYEITIHRSGGTSYYLEEYIYQEPNKRENIEPFIYLQMKNGEGVISTKEGEKQRVHFQKYPYKRNGISFKTEELVLRQISDPNRYFPLYTLKSAIEETVVYNYFDTTLNSKIRQPKDFETKEKLLANGENLTQILNRLKNNHTLEYNEVQELIKKINPHFIEISFNFFGSLLYLTFEEKNLSKTVGVRHISDGSLRYLLLLTIFLNPENGQLLCIDEPEIGLHPDMTNTIAKLITNASFKNNTQIIIATHSALLLNSFDLEDLLIFEKNNNNSSIVLKKTEADFEDWGDDFLVGQMWLNGELGGKRW